MLSNEVAAFSFTVFLLSLNKSCAYDVPGMILLHDLKGTMRLDRSKDMSVHVSTCTSYDFNTLTPVVWKLWR
jgi:hypothetical protein